MDRNELKGRILASDRVQHFATEAVRSVVHRVLGDKLDREEARTLALAGDLESAVRKLKQRRQIRRHHLDANQQRRLAVQEVSLELAGRSEKEIAALVSEAVRRAREAKRGVLSIQERAAQQRQFFKDFDTQAPMLRRFLREANRLMSRQTRTLQAGIRDPDALGAAIEELEAVYKRHLDDAFQIVAGGSGEVNTRA